MFYLTNFYYYWNVLSNQLLIKLRDKINLNHPLIFLKGLFNSVRLTKFIFMFAFSKACFRKNKIGFLFSWLDGMTKLRVTRMSHSTRMIAFNQFLFIDQIARLEWWTLPFPGWSARVRPVEGWNFDLANSDAFVSTNSTCLERFCHPANIGMERAPSENCSPLYENVRMHYPMSDPFCDASSLSFNYLCTCEIHSTDGA